MCFFMCEDDITPNYPTLRGMRPDRWPGSALTLHLHSARSFRLRTGFVFVAGLRLRELQRFRDAFSFCCSFLCCEKLLNSLRSKQPFMCSCLCSPALCGSRAEEGAPETGGESVFFYVLARGAAGAGDAFCLWVSGNVWFWRTYRDLSNELIIARVGWWPVTMSKRA